MRTVGIIAEYNPLHTGHEYHLQKAKEAARADYAVVVLSPDYVQRGEPALFDKYTRAQMALLAGADLVLELPVCYAAGSAEYFAEGAATLLDCLHTVDALASGQNRTMRILFLRLLPFSLKNRMPFPKRLVHIFVRAQRTRPRVPRRWQRSVRRNTVHVTCADSSHLRTTSSAQNTAKLF